MIEIISHPGKLLIVHLREVARFSAETIGNLNLSFDFDQKLLATLAFIQGAVHDIGKATENFQIYIKSKGEIVNHPKHHALISAFLAKEIVGKYLETTSVGDFDKKILPYFIFTSVKRHHGNLKNFDDELESLKAKEEDLAILTENFYDEEVQEILDELLAEIGFQYQWNTFKSYMKDLNLVFKEYSCFVNDFLLFEYDEQTSVEKAKYFYIHQLLFSTLLYSDKTDVKLGENKLERNALFDFEAVRKYRKRKKFDQAGSEINQLKNKAYFEGLDFLQNNFDKNQHLYSITLPTGLGKTITSLAIAMEMKKMIGQQNPKIIITIPFTSIIDQNYSVFEDILNNPSSNVLLKHHHLAEPKYNLADDTVGEPDVEKSKFLIETWQSEIVVTTFVQLLEALFTNNKGKLLKLPNLTNSIIILDEIQQVKFELWSLIRRAFEILGGSFNCYFILMSATQPLIFEPGKEIQELIPNYQQYFKFFNRTQLINKTSESITLDDFNDLVANYFIQNPAQNILVILNTKQTTLDCFKALDERIPKEQANLYFLATSLTPFERKRIIELIKTPTNKLPNIIVSTQLIEAGVDISVNVVFRAIAPLDSIIQAAGRANRYFENPLPASVCLYKIEELEKANKIIYGPTLMMKTENVLEKINTIQETDYLQIIEAYFNEIKKQSLNIASKELKALEALKFADLGKFSFIEYRKTESIFVQLNKEAKELWEKYLEIYRNGEYSIFKKRELFALIKASFYDYVVNVPVPYDSEYIIFDSEPEMHFYLSKLENPSNCYSYSASDFRMNFGYQPKTDLTL